MIELIKFRYWVAMNKSELPHGKDPERLVGIWVASISIGSLVVKSKGFK